MMSSNSKWVRFRGSETIQYIEARRPHTQQSTHTPLWETDSTTHIVSTQSLRKVSCRGSKGFVLRRTQYVRSLFGTDWFQKFPLLIIWGYKINTFHWVSQTAEPGALVMWRPPSCIKTLQWGLSIGDLWRSLLFKRSALSTWCWPTEGVD